MRTPHEEEKGPGGDLVRVRRGAYTEPTALDPDRRREHLQLVQATARRCSAEAVVSHLSAAALHGLPMPADDIVTVAGLRVTSLARTVLDLSCALPMRQVVRWIWADLQQPEHLVAKLQRAFARARRST